MSETQGRKGRIHIPVQGADLPSFLVLIMEADTGAADTAINAALESVVLKEFENWYKIRPRALDQAMLKKIRNSASSAGTQGDRRTLEALLSMDIWPSAMKNLTAEEASEQLRVATQELRRAKTYLFHQAKCIRYVLSFVSEELSGAKQKSLNREISSLATFKLWGQDVWKLWRENSSMEMKNRLMISNFWLVFFDSFTEDAEGLVSKYSQALRSKLSEYISPDEYVSLFERTLLTNLDNLKMNSNSSMSDFNSASDAIQMDTKISGQIVTIIFRMENWSQAKLASAKIGLTFELSGDPIFDDLDLAVTSSSSLHSEIRLSLNKPKSPAVLELIAQKALKFLTN
jgi:hypothetical protein